MLMQNSDARRCLEFCIFRYRNLAWDKKRERESTIRSLPKRSWFDNWIWGAERLDRDSLTMMNWEISHYDNKVAECLEILNRIKYNQENQMTFQENVPDQYFQLWMGSK